MKDEEIQKLYAELNRLEQEISYLDGMKLDLMWKAGEIKDRLHELGGEVI